MFPFFKVFFFVSLSLVLFSLSSLILFVCIMLSVSLDSTDHILSVHSRFNQEQNGDKSDSIHHHLVKTLSMKRISFFVLMDCRPCLDMHDLHVLYCSLIFLLQTGSRWERLSTYKINNSLFWYISN